MTTPETLRGHAAYYRERDDFGDEGLAEISDAAADAWEEKEQLLDEVNDRLAALEPKLDRIQRNTDLIIVERDDYRKRLAEAEKALLGFLEYEDPIGGISDMPSGPFDRARAALAPDAPKETT